MPINRTIVMRDHFRYQLLMSAALTVTLANVSFQPAFARVERADLANAIVQRLLKVDKDITVADSIRIANARSLGLPDNASQAMIEDRAWQKYAVQQAQIYGWPIGLNKQDFAKLADKQKRDDLCRSTNLPDSASDAQLEEASRHLKDQQKKLMAEEQAIQLKHLPVDLENQAYNAVMEKQKELSRPGAARMAGLPPSATWQQIKSKQQDDLNQQLKRKYGLSKSVSKDQLNLAIKKHLDREQTEMARRILKAPKTQSDSEIWTQMQILAKALGYSKDAAIHSEGEIFTADDLFTQITQSKAK
jgi:hypothetical protein